MERTEFFETAVQQGFYGNEKTSLWGKKDNVRRFWEDIFTKLLLRPAVAQLLKEEPRLRVVDLGCGSGEGLDLLRHIPLGASPHEPSQNFLLNWPEIEIYDGVDLSSAMILQGQTNYANRDNAQFPVGDLSQGFPLTDRPPYHLYLSTYASLSHLTFPELEHLLCDIFKHAQEHAYVLIDVYGRWSPEWPVYWSASASKLEPYTMAYLYDQRQLDRESVEWFKVSYWTAAELESAVRRAAEKAGVRVNVSAMKDRSILVGRRS
ncbi:MAG: class I SAM-dependent methyltransferase [Candidatus Hydrogenedentes bacterium]|nr:class I SAM-dependent methyltransferase [Candidatus Hydrogenedentota bacterium]